MSFRHFEGGQRSGNFWVLLFLLHEPFFFVVFVLFYFIRDQITNFSIT